MGPSANQVGAGSSGVKKVIRSYFMVDYSFYSKEHGGTFHFLQFNIMRT